MAAAGRRSGGGRCGSLRCWRTYRIINSVQKLVQILILGCTWPIGEPWQQLNPSRPIPLSSARARRPPSRVRSRPRNRCVRCLPRLGQCGIQASDRQGLAKALAAKPGQFFNILCPSPDDGDLWLQPAAEHLSHRPRTESASSFSTNASAGAPAAWRPSSPGMTAIWSGRWASDSRIRRGRTSSCSAVASVWPRWGRFRSSRPKTASA